MRRNKTVFLWMYLGIAEVSVFNSHAVAKDTKEITCTGKVIDEQGRSIAGTAVNMFLN